MSATVQSTLQHDLAARRLRGIPYGYRSRDRAVNKPNGLGTVTYVAPAGYRFRKADGEVTETCQAAISADGSTLVDNYRSSVQYGNLMTYVQQCDGTKAVYEPGTDSTQEAPIVTAKVNGSDGANGDSSDLVQRFKDRGVSESDIISRLKARLKNMNQHVDLSRLNTVDDLRTAIKSAQLTKPN